MGVNLVTQPALTLLLVNGPLTEPVGEALVMRVEWPIERGVLRLTWRRALEVSVAANLTSWGIGFFL